MNLQTNDQSQKLILRRIDAIIAELQALRQQVQTVQAVQATTPPSTNLVDELAGALGNGRWDEYDKLLDWERFNL
jgi:ABC-type amino acid transport substrate-binding protein